MIFYLGTHKAEWLANDRFRDVPLFVSRRVLENRRSLPRATTRWSLDSGGFTEISLHGRWVLTERAYVQIVRRMRDEVGRLDWAAPNDWMCEPPMLKRTGLTVLQHQRRTVDNFLRLRELAPELPFVPVLQGWTLTDYWRHMDQYDLAGVELKKEKTVGVGTLCRRQGTGIAERVLTTIAAHGLRLHGFGFKVRGVKRCEKLLASADSLAWSFHARRRPPLLGHDRPGPGRTKGHKNCANCAEYALWWLKEHIQS